MNEMSENRVEIRCIRHCKPGLINNFDHMHISGNEPSSVIISQTKYTQQHKLRTAYSSNDFRGIWVAIY